MNRRFLYLILSTVLSACWIYADENYYFRHYTNRDGLSHNTVFCSFQDKNGFLWFGTEDGLNRFDGYSFRIFRYQYQGNTEGGLLNDRIYCIEEDSYGRIWICTGGGVCYYDYASDSFYPLISENDSTPYYAQQVFEDKEGHIWLRDYSRITMYTPDDKSFKIFRSNEYRIRSVTMTMSEDGVPVFADATSVYVYKPDIENFSRLLSLSDFLDNKLTVITSVQEVPQVGFFIGTDLEGLFLYHAGNEKIESIIPETHVRAILPYSANTYWIASESGIYIYNLIDRSLTNLRKSLINEYTIADNAVYSLTKDREGGVWVGSFFGGINYLPKNYTNFTYYIGGKTHAGMLGNTIREICPDKYGNLWLGTEDNGVNRFEPATSNMENYSLLNPVRKLAATNIHGLYAEGDTLWIGSFNKGIELLHIPTGKILKSYTPSNTNGGLISNFVLCFYKTKKGDFLVGTANGVLLFDKKNETFSRWKGTQNLIRQILEDKEGNIWIPTDNGVYKYTPSFPGLKDGAGYTEKIVKYASQHTGLGSSNTTSVFEDSKGRIRITTTNGFSLYDKETDAFSRITTTDGLPGNVIYRIVEDDDGLFWIATANGLVRYNPETNAMHTYNYSDGLHETQFNYSSSYKSPDGTIYMGTINGMVSFNPKHFTNDTYAPPLYITRIHTHDDKQDSRFLPVTAGKPYTLKLPYKSSTFTISYIAPFFTSPDAIKYAYLLEGIDKEWIYMGRNKDVTFANLSPGNYIFHVRSTNSNDVWQNNEQSLQIIITPPFYSTVWAYLIYLMIFVVGLIIFYRYKKRQFMIRALHSQELFEIEKEKDLYNAKIQFFTFITHEIRTPLTLIKAPLEKIIRSNDGNETTRKNLNIIEKNTQRLLDLSNQLLDFRKTENRGFRLNFVKTNMNQLMENIIAPFMPAFLSENKKLTVNLPEKHLFACIDSDAFTKIATNLLTNALKYSTGLVYLELLQPDDEKGLFAVVIKNDGRLIPEKERANIFEPFFRLKETENIQGSGIGLTLSRTLAGFHNGAIEYVVSQDGLNQFILTLPVRQKESNFDLSEKPREQGNARIENSREHDLLEKPAEAIRSVAPERPSVLIVEDRQEMRSYLADELNAHYDISDAENGIQALSLLEEKNIDLIISDIMMPEMDGYELCCKVKNDVRFSHIPFILLTAQHNLQSRLKGLNQGADAYLEKPFSLEHLATQVDSLLKNRERLLKAFLEKPLTPTTSLALSLVDKNFIEKLNDYVVNNLVNDLSVDTIASEMGMSSSSLYRKVKGIAGLSPVDFIRIARLKKSVLLMQAGERRIGEIAYMVGISSPAYFSTLFLKQYGKTPKEFMKEIN